MTLYNAFFKINYNAPIRLIQGFLYASYIIILTSYKKPLIIKNRFKCTLKAHTRYFLF